MRHCQYEPILSAALVGMYARKDLFFQSERFTMTLRDLIILGCSSQQPTRKRNHGAYLVRGMKKACYLIRVKGLSGNLSLRMFLRPVPREFLSAIFMAIIVSASVRC